MLRFVILILCSLLVCGGCGQQAKTETKAASQDPQCVPTPVRNFQTEQKAKSLSERVGGIDQAVAVHIDKQMIVALQVSNFNRLRLKPLKKQVSQQLKSAFPGNEIRVTTDSKMYNELEKLSKKPWTNEQESACKQKKKLMDIEKMRD
ncbi:YhcN/YlaJ family sporulation lipoprotein [Paenibacillus alkalitolerans]|uniref:YhcN/YlaJ family sporulation lipoprotein n=1 Tax=Paenibacillus alkalitolerans TaxID=2799335 RepID=UPI001F1C3E45|nr:YhcN/YlaJ family sporulation lipoprotein [Paenibacillus alkalitolerans]